MAWRGQLKGREGGRPWRPDAEPGWRWVETITGRFLVGSQVNQRGVGQSVSLFLLRERRGEEEEEEALAALWTPSYFKKWLWFL